MYQNSPFVRVTIVSLDGRAGHTESNGDSHSGGEGHKDTDENNGKVDKDGDGNAAEKKRWNLSHQIRKDSMFNQLNWQ